MAVAHSPIKIAPPDGSPLLNPEETALFFLKIEFLKNALVTLFLTFVALCEVIATAPPPLTVELFSKVQFSNIGSACSI